MTLPFTEIDSLQPVLRCAISLPRRRLHNPSAIWLRQSAVAAVRAGAAIAQSHAELQTEIAERQRAQRERGEFEEQMRHAQKLESIGLLAGGIAHDHHGFVYVADTFNGRIQKFAP